MNQFLDTNGLKTYHNLIKDLLGSIEKIEHSALVQKLNEGKLVPSRKYLITDYQMTSKYDTTQTVNNQFDIIVEAISNNQLDLNAKAIRHENGNWESDARPVDTIDFSKWELKYSLSGVEYMLDKDIVEVLVNPGDDFIAPEGILVLENNGLGCNTLANYEISGTAEIETDKGVQQIYYNALLQPTGLYSDHWDDGDFVLSRFGMVLRDSNSNPYIIRANNYRYQDASKGAIIYLKDDLNNEATYDFYNVKFEITEQSTDESTGENIETISYLYTFSYIDDQGEYWAHTTHVNNKIISDINTLPFNVLKGESSNIRIYGFHNILNNCWDLIIRKECTNNTFAWASCSDYNHIYNTIVTGSHRLTPTYGQITLSQDVYTHPTSDYDLITKGYVQSLIENAPVETRNSHIVLLSNNMITSGNYYPYDGLFHFLSSVLRVTVGSWDDVKSVLEVIPEVVGMYKPLKFYILKDYGDTAPDIRIIETSYLYQDGQITLTYHEDLLVKKLCLGEYDLYEEISHTDKIFPLFEETSLDMSSYDLNYYTDDGIYKSTDSVRVTQFWNSPYGEGQNTVAGSWCFIVINSGKGRVRLIYYDLGGETIKKDIFERYKSEDNDIWSTWTRIKDGGIASHANTSTHSGTSTVLLPNNSGDPKGITYKSSDGGVIIRIPYSTDTNFDSYIHLYNNGTVEYENQRGTYELQRIVQLNIPVSENSLYSNIFTYFSELESTIFGSDSYISGIYSKLRSCLITIGDLQEVPILYMYTQLYEDDPDYIGLKFTYNNIPRILKLYVNKSEYIIDDSSHFIAGDNITFGTNTSGQTVINGSASYTLPKASDTQLGGLQYTGNASLFLNGNGAFTSVLKGTIGGNELTGQSWDFTDAVLIDFSPEMVTRDDGTYYTKGRISTGYAKHEEGSVVTIEDTVVIDGEKGIEISAAKGITINGQGYINFPSTSQSGHIILSGDNSYISIAGSKANFKQGDHYVVTGKDIYDNIATDEEILNMLNGIFGYTIV